MHFVVIMHFSPVLRRDVLISGRSVRQSLLCIDPPEELLYGQPDCLHETGVAWTGHSRKAMQQINSSGRIMVSVCTTRFNIKYSAFYQRTRVL